MTTNKLLLVLSFMFLLCVGQGATAANFSFTGNFNKDNDVQLFSFTIGADSTTVAINTLSLLGGVNLNGQSIAGDGFNPYLAIFEQNTGLFVFDTLNKATNEEAVIANSGSHFYGTLSAGSYILALTQLDNVALGANLADGFADSLGLATFGASPFTAQNGGGSSHWAVDIANVDSAHLATVPLPGALLLFLQGLLVLPIARSLTRHNGVNV
ncbi:DVUA0089 family protein [Methylocucumis oryzae]|nr:DVUA0089 family protein [Methylocucumis oryzae]